MSILFGYSLKVFSSFHIDDIESRKDSLEVFFLRCIRPINKRLVEPQFLVFLSILNVRQMRAGKHHVTDSEIMYAYLFYYTNNQSRTYIWQSSLMKGFVRWYHEKSIICNEGAEFKLAFGLPRVRVFFFLYLFIYFSWEEKFRGVWDWVVCSILRHRIS